MTNPEPAKVPFTPQGLQQVAKSVEALAVYVKEELARLKDRVDAVEPVERGL